MVGSVYDSELVRISLLQRWVVCSPVMTMSHLSRSAGIGGGFVLTSPHTTQIEKFACLLILVSEI